MLIEGFKVLRIGDNSYEVRDSVRSLGGVVRYWLPSLDGNGTMMKKFRAPYGNDFDSLREAVSWFSQIPYARPFDAKGDAEAS